MATIQNKLIADLSELGLIHTQAGGGWKIDLGNARRLGLTKSTAYRWLSEPPRHFTAMLAELAELQREVKRQRRHALPVAWADSGFWFDDAGYLVAGSSRGNPFAWLPGDILASHYRQAALKSRIEELRRELSQVKRREWLATAANDGG